MARTETVENIILQAKERSDMQNSGFISDAEWLRLLNLWVAKLHNKLVRITPERYMREQQLTPDGTTTDFDTPDDYFGTIGVEYRQGADSAYSRLQFLTGPDELPLSGSSNERAPFGYTFRYNLGNPETDLLRILPAPSAQYQIRHRYLVTAPVHVALDTVKLVSGFEDFIILGMQIDALIKEGTSVVQPRKSMAEMVFALDQAAELRNAGKAGKVADVRTNYHTDPSSVWWARGI